MRTAARDREDEIVTAVLRLLETEGYDAVQVRRVAAEASISLTTLYKLFGSRDELIIRALERWMRDNVYAGLETLPAEGTPYEQLRAIVRSVFARWERQPHMLVAYIRARLSPGGHRLDLQGFGEVNARALSILEELDPEHLADVVMILEHVNIAAIERFASGEIAVPDIASIYERTLRRVLGEARTGQPVRPASRRPSRARSPR